MNTYEEQYETFIGKQFHYKEDADFIYTFAPIEDGRAVITRGDHEKVTYSIEDALRLIRDFKWILIEN